MIYTIDCRYRECGASYSAQTLKATLSGDLVRMESTMRGQGWEVDYEGWRCPFHAPKEAAKADDEDVTACHFARCLNYCKGTSEAELAVSGWRSAGIVGGSERWICPACWKTTQPEPAPEPVHEFPLWAANEMKVIAAEVAKAEVRAFVDRVRHQATTNDSYVFQDVALMLYSESSEMQADIAADKQEANPPMPTYPEEPGTKDNPYDTEIPF